MTFVPLWLDRTRERPVRAVVWGVWRGLRAALFVECALFFVAGTLGTRAAGLASGAEDWWVSALAGAACALTWGLEHRRGVAATARVLDRALSFRGALTTAFELEERGAPLAPMEALLCWQVRRRLVPREAFAALFPPLFLPLAAPTAAALCLVLVVDARREGEVERPDLLALARGLDRALDLSSLGAAEAAGTEPDGRRSHAQHQALTDVLQGRSALPFSEEEWARDPVAHSAALQELDRRIDVLLQGLEPGSELRPDLEDARNWLDALRMGLAEVGGPALAASSAGSGAAPLTGSTADGTISPPKPAPETMVPDLPPADVSNATPSSAAPAGLQASPWWPREYDPIVVRWLELTRDEARR